METRVNRNAIRRRYDANHMLLSWVNNIHGVTTSYIPKMTTGGETSGSGVKFEMQRVLESVPYKTQKRKRKEVFFLRIVVGEKPLELTQGRSENVLFSSRNLQLSVENRKLQCQALVSKNVSQRVSLILRQDGCEKELPAVQTRGRKKSRCKTDASIRIWRHWTNTGRR